MCQRFNAYSEETMQHEAGVYGPSMSSREACLPFFTINWFICEISIALMGDSTCPFNLLSGVSTTACCHLQVLNA